MSQTQFGPLIQNGYVVRNLERAVHHWATVVGVGPFFVLEHVAYGDVFFRGKPAKVDMSVAVGYWGDMQVELIVQHNDAPSIYSEFAVLAGEGLQHIGVMTDSVPEHLQRLHAQGIDPIQWGETANGIRFAYISTDAHLGGMIELIERGPVIEGFFRMARAAAENWDGSNPLRRVG
jgi:hypothetical protein